MTEPGNAWRVVKLGGSLLDLPNLDSELRRWLALQSSLATLLVLGGGAAAEAVRELDRTEPLGATEAHWRAIAAMSANARALAARWPDATMTDSLAAARSLRGGTCIGILDAEPFLRDADVGVDELPHSWDVTSDSIAAHIARMLSAKELVLLKSRLPPEPATLEQAASTSYVDPWFPRAAAGLSVVRCVNLREARFPEQSPTQQRPRSG